MHSDDHSMLFLDTDSSCVPLFWMMNSLSCFPAPLLCRKTTDVQQLLPATQFAKQSGFRTRGWTS